MESTVLDILGTVPRILRPGGVSLEALSSVLGLVELAGRSQSTLYEDGLESPGLLAKHYAPKVDFLLFLGPEQESLDLMRKKACDLLVQGKRVGIMSADEDVMTFEIPGLVVERLGQGETYKR